MADANRAVEPLLRRLIARYPDEAARRLEELAPEDGVHLFEALSTREAVALISRTNPDIAASLIARIPPAIAVPVVEGLEPMRGALLLAVLDPGKREELLAAIDRTKAAELKELASYPPGTAGALMDPVVLGLRPDTTVGKALKHLRRFRDRKVHRVFVVGDDRRLLGSAPLRDIATADPQERLVHLMRPELAAVPVTAGRDEVVELSNQRKRASLPVVDFDGRLVGVLRSDTLMAAVQEEASADLQSLFGAGRQERALSPVSFAVKKRLPWLEVNLGTAFLAAAVVGIFEETIARFTALAILLPVVAGQSGNTGAQALAVTMRGLALREIRVRQWARVCFKESRVACVNGIAVALTTSLAVFVWSRSLGLALVIASSMVISMIAAGLSGAGIPLLLTALKQDPAQSSSIVLTTVTDVVGFMSFLGIATLFAGLL